MDDFEQPIRRVTQDFVETKIDGVLWPRVVGTEVYFNGERNSYTGIDENTSKGNVYAEAEMEKTRLHNAMADFRQTSQVKINKRQTAGMDSKPSDHQDWSDVTQEMLKAQEAYQKRHDGNPSAAIQKLCTSVGNSGATFQAWLSLLPDGDYTSVVCGAFKMVINAAVRASKIRDLIFDNLEKIPVTLDTAREYLMMNNLYKSIALHCAFSRLYTAILVAFEHMLDWLSKSSLRHAAGALFKQGNYETLLETKIEAVRNCSADVRQQAEICSQYLIGSIDTKISRQTVQLAGVTVTLHGVKGTVDGLSNTLAHIGDNSDTLLQGNARIEDRLNAMYNFFQSDLQKSLTTLTTNVQRPAKRKHRGNSSFKAAHLQALLDFDPMEVKRDITNAISHGQVLTSEKQERTKSFSGSRRLKIWLTSQVSDVLLANGNADDDKISPLSYACGILATSLRSFHGALVLSFFCGMHLSKKNEEVGAGHMLVSLISQLSVGFHQFDFKFRKSWGYKNSDFKINSLHRIDALCALIRELVGQLPEDRVVFCLLDGIQYYEFDDRRKHMCQAIYQILDLMLNTPTKAILKLLITTPARSTAVYKIIPPENIWFMLAEIERSDQGFNKKQAIMETSESMESAGSSSNNYAAEGNGEGLDFVDDENEDGSSGIDSNYSDDSYESDYH